MNSPVRKKHSYEQAINKEYMYKWAISKYQKVLRTEISVLYFLPSYTQRRANVGLQL